MQLSGVRTFFDMGSLDPRLGEASVLEPEEEGLELEELSDLILAEGCDVEVAKHLRHATDVDDAGEGAVGNQRKGFRFLIERMEVSDHLL